MNVKQILMSTSGKIFTCTFIKKNGEERKIHARLGVTKHLKGGIKGYDYDHLVTVFDLKAKEYRTINAETVKEIKFGKKVFSF